MRCQADAPSIAAASNRHPVDAHDRREVDDRAVAGALPEVRQGDDDRPRARRAVDLDRLAAGLLDEAVERAVVVVQKVERDDADEHDRDEVRQEHDALLIFLKYFSRISLSMIAKEIARMFPSTMNARL